MSWLGIVLGVIVALAGVYYLVVPHAPGIQKYHPWERERERERNPSDYGIGWTVLHYSVGVVLLLLGAFLLFVGYTGVAYT